MKIGIIGTGAMGTVLARRLARLGHAVALASPRGGAKVARLAAELGSNAASAVDAARESELVILAIPTFAIAEVPRAWFAGAPGVLVDLSNYHPELRDGPIQAIDAGLPESQWVEERLDHPVVKAFNNVLPRSLLEKGAPPGAPHRVALPVAGDAETSRALVLHVVEELGFDGLDAGQLRHSWRQGTGTPAYCRDLDRGALSRALDAAEQSRVGEYRAAEEARIRRAMAVAR